MDLRPRVGAALVVEVMVPDHADVRDREPVHQPQVVLVPLRRPGAGKVAQVGEEHRRGLDQRDLAEQLRVDAVGGGIGPRAAVSRDHEGERVADRRRADPLGHRAISSRGVHFSIRRSSRTRPLPTKEVAMKYVMLIHHGDEDPEAWERLSKDEQAEVSRGYQEINRTPGVTPGLWMQPPDAATTVRVEDGRTLTTDGPFATVKEALGGYFILEADDLDAAIEVASRVPAARMGGAVEVRPVVEH
jgi:hypothetical protein